MCYIKAYSKLHPICAESASSGGGIPITYLSKIDALLLIGHTLKFIDIFLQSFKENYSRQTITSRKNMSELFYNIIPIIKESKTDNYKNKIQAMLTDMGGKWYISKIN